MTENSDDAAFNQQGMPQILNVHCYLSDTAREKIRTLPEAQQMAAAQRMNQLADKVWSMALVAGVEMPLLAFDEAVGDQQQCPFTYGKTRSPLPQRYIIYIDPRFIPGLEPLQALRPVPDYLQLTDSEIHTALAHEMGHIIRGDEFSSHITEYGADREMIRLGGTPEDMANVLLKSVRFGRESDYETYQEEHERLAEPYKPLSTLMLYQRAQRADSLRHGGNTHPALKPREEAARRWQERLALGDNKGEGADVSLPDR